MIKKNNVITKSNLFNQLTPEKLTLNQLRFFCIYLSRINPKKVESREVVFTYNEFIELLGLKRVLIDNIKTATNELLAKTITIKNEDGGFTSYQLFKECSFYKVDNDNCYNWFIKIDAHDKALPLFFDFKKNFFSYQLYNILSLKSVNQIRMYEILKQYQSLGKRELDLDELKQFLGIDKDKYKRWDNFKNAILNTSQIALKDNTDIEFTYKTASSGVGKKVNKVIFKIEKNTKNTKSDNETQDEILLENTRKYEQLEKKYKNKKLFLLASSCQFEFNEFELQLLYDLIIKVIPWTNSHSDIEQFDYLKLKYDELLYRATQKEIKSRFGYLKTLIQLDIE